MKIKISVRLITAAILGFFCASHPLQANNLPFAHDISVKNAGSSGALSPFISDTNSPYVNPAGLGLLRKQEIGGMYYNLFAGSLISSLSYALPLLDAGAISASMVYLSSGDIDGLNINNQPTGDFYSESYLSLSMSYGISLFSVAGAGLTLKYLNHNIAVSGSSAYGIDLGAIAVLPFNIRLSVFLENAIKPEFKNTGSVSDILPVYFNATLAGSYSLLAGLDDSIKAGAGITGEEYNSSPGWHAGVEYSVYNGLAAARAGIKESGFSLGFSLSYEGASFDYAYVRMPYDFMHRFSLSYCFGRDVRAMEQAFKTKEEKLKYELVRKIMSDSLDGLKSAVTASLAAGDAESALVSVQKALVWAPDEEWFKKQKQEIEALISKSRKERLSVEADKLLKEGSYFDAMIALKNLLDTDPDNKDAKLKYAGIAALIRSQNEKNMETESVNKDLLIEQFDTGLDFYSSGQLEEALNVWNKIIKSSPMQKQVYDLINSTQEKIRKTREQAKTVGIIKREKISALYNEAVVLHTKGRFEESINVWKQLLEFDPGNTEAKEYLNKVTDEYRKIQRQNLEW